MYNFHLKQLIDESGNTAKEYLTANVALVDCIRSFDNGLHLLDAPTGSGKTYLMGVLAQEKPTLILSPFVALSGNIHTEVQKQVGDGSIVDGSIVGVCTGNNHDWNHNIVICTYDKFVNVDAETLSKFHRVFIDEPQTMYEDGYRVCMPDVYKRLSKVSKDIPVFALSATLIEEMLPLFNKINVTADYGFEPTVSIHPDKQWVHDAYIIDRAKTARDTNQVLCLLVNNKKTLDIYASKLKEHGVESTLVTSETKNEERTKAMLATQQCQTPVLLMTKAGQAGLSFTNTNLLEKILVLDAGMTPQSIKQYVSRFRAITAPRVKLLLNINVDNKDAVKKMLDSFNRRPLFNTTALLMTATSSFDSLRSTFAVIDNDIAATMLLDGLKATGKIESSVSLQDVRSGDAFCDVIAAQSVEEQRRDFYNYNLGSLVRDIPYDVDVTMIGNIESIEDSEDIQKHKAKVRKLKQTAKNEYFDTFVNASQAKQKITSDSVINGIHGSAYEEAQAVYESMKTDGASAVLMKSLYNDFKVKSLSKYKSVGKLIVKYNSDYQELIGNAKDAGLVGKKIEMKHYDTLIDMWLGSSNSQFIKALSNTSASFKRDVFQSVFTVKNSKTGNTDYKKVLNVKSIAQR